MRRFSMSMALLTLLALAAAGCTSARRLAPPGIFVYESARVDREPNPYVEQRIDEISEKRDGAFPLLSDTPAAAPEALSPDARKALEERLLMAAEAEKAAAAQAASDAEQDRAVVKMLIRPAPKAPEPAPETGG